MHTSCALALVAPAEALAAWEIVSVAALVLQHAADFTGCGDLLALLLSCGSQAPSRNVLHICEAPEVALASL